MKIWIDGDGCPARVRRIVCRAARRMGVKAIFVANIDIPLPDSPFLSFVKVETRSGSADAVIRSSTLEGDLVVSADIPLAADVIDKGAIVLHPRGGVYTKKNISERRSLRDYSQNLRDLGEDTRDPKRHRSRRYPEFADSLDRELTKGLRARPG